MLIFFKGPCQTSSLSATTFLGHLPTGHCGRLFQTPQMMTLLFLKITGVAHSQITDSLLRWCLFVDIWEWGWQNIILLQRRWPCRSYSVANPSPGVKVCRICHLILGLELPAYHQSHLLCLSSTPHQGLRVGADCFLLFSVTFVFLHDLLLFSLYFYDS
jgi:hypothetical protein